MTQPHDPALGAGPAESSRLRRMHLPQRASLLGVSVREADRQLNLNGGADGLLDTTHFDTVRFPPPPWAAEVMQAAVADGTAAYTAYRGAPEVLRQTADSVSAFLGVPVTEANLMIAAGTQGGLFSVLSALVDDGDLVLLADPEYLFIERMLEFLGARVERIAITRQGDVASLDLDRVEQLLPQHPRLLLFSHPSNPTGAVYTPEVLARVAELATRGGFRVVVDELYSRLVYDETPFTHLAILPGMDERCVTLLGPSKTESLSGFRIGLVVGPEDVIAATEQILAITSLRAPAYAQRLLPHWLVDDVDFVAARVLELSALRSMTLDALRAVPGLTVAEPQGTAYAFPDVSALGASDIVVARTLQEEAGVIVSPGYQFGPSAMGHFRVCYARDEEEWAAALDRIVKSLERLAT